MKAKFEYDLEVKDDKDKYEHACNAIAYHNSLFQIVSLLNYKCFDEKGDLSLSQQGAVIELKKEIDKILEDYGVKL